MTSEINKVTYAFNKFFGVLVRDIKEINEELHGVIKKNYKVIDKASCDYLAYFWENVGKCLTERSFDVNAESSKDVLLVKDVKLGDVLSAIEDSTSLINSIYTLGIFAYLQEKTDSEETFDATLRILGAFQKGNKELFDEELEDIIDDDLKYLFTKLVFAGVEETAAPNVSDEGLNDVFEKFGNSKICEIAKEVSQKIDVSQLKVDNPTDVFNMLNFSSSNNVLGNIVQQVTSTIQDKMTNGDLKQEDLIQEAMSMMGSLGGANSFMSNPLFADLMKNMSGGGKVGIKKDVLSKMATKDRLKKKLQLRKSNTTS